MEFINKQKHLAIIQYEVNLKEIEMISDLGLKMPPKTSFFYPKPMIGMIFKTFNIN